MTHTRAISEVMSVLAVAWVAGCTDVPSLETRSSPAEASAELKPEPELALALSDVDQEPALKPMHELKPDAGPRLPQFGVDPDATPEPSLLTNGLVALNRLQPLAVLPRHVTTGAVAQGEGVFVFADFNRPVREPYLATSIYVVNRGSDTLALPMVDELSNFVIELRGPGDEWTAHYPAPKAFCGNSYHTLELPAGSFIRLEGPRWSSGPRRQVRFHNLRGPDLVSNSGTLALGDTEHPRHPRLGYMETPKAP